MSRYLVFLFSVFLFFSCENTVTRFLGEQDTASTNDRENPADTTTPSDDSEILSDGMENNETTGDEVLSDEEEQWLADSDDPWFTDSDESDGEDEPSEETTEEIGSDLPFVSDESPDAPIGEEADFEEEVSEDATMPDSDGPDEETEDTPAPDTEAPDDDGNDEAPESDTGEPDLIDDDAATDLDFADDMPLPDEADFDTADEDATDDDGGPDIDFLDETIALIDKQNMTDIVYYLASPDCAGRNNTTTGSTNARNRIIAELTAAGIEPGGASDSWTQSFAYWCPWFTYTRGNNIIGFLEGSHPTLKNEFVVLGAHYDHLGTSGSIYYPGADDNASGSAILIEIAAALKRIQPYLDRSVVFIWFDAEEDGLCGSDYYVDHPLFPLAATVYMIDLDMVGYLRNNALELTDTRGSMWGENTLSALAVKYNLTVTFPDCGYDCSDHAPFYNAGIPSLMITTGLEDVYHKTTDTADKINYDGMVTVAAYTTDFAYQVNTHIAPFFAPFELPAFPTVREFRDHGILPPNTPRD